MPRLLTLLVTLLLGLGCAHGRSTASSPTPRDEPGPVLGIPGLTSCDPDRPAPPHLDPAAPLTLLVHGCNFSRGGFRLLARVLEAQQRQVLCFGYDDRDSLQVSSGQLIEALEGLEVAMVPGLLTVIGHSQGGLVSRRALIAEREGAFEPNAGFRYRLVTISSPFAGIRSSRDCGRTWLHLATLGVTVGVCQGIAGDKWREIPPGSGFMEQPGTLLPAVAHHLRIGTDERDSCRERRADGRCAVDDFVFSIEEQRNPAVDGDPRVTAVDVRAGHSEIVGELGHPPERLLAILQEHDVLAASGAEDGAAFAALVRQLYR